MVKDQAALQLGAGRHAEKIKTGKSTAELTRRRHLQGVNDIIIINTFSIRQHMWTAVIVVATVQ